MQNLEQTLISSSSDNFNTETSIDKFLCFEFGGGPTGFGGGSCRGPGGFGGGDDGNGGPKKPFDPYAPKCIVPSQSPFEDNWGVKAYEPIDNPREQKFEISGYVHEQGSNEPFIGNPWEVNTPLETMPFENPQLLRRPSNFDKPYLPSYDDCNELSPYKPIEAYNSFDEPVKFQPVDYAPLLPDPIELEPFKPTLHENTFKPTSFNFEPDLPSLPHEFYELPKKMFDLDRFDSPKVGLLNNEPFQYGYDMPECKIQFHLHGSDEDHLTFGKIKDYQDNTLKKIRDSYDLAMVDLTAKKLGFKKFP